MYGSHVHDDFGAETSVLEPEEEAPLLSCLAFHSVPARKEWRDVGLGTPVRRRETVRLQVPFQLSGRVPGGKSAPG